MIHYIKHWNQDCFLWSDWFYGYQICAGW